MDPNVLAAQQWVNSTYADVSGYNRIAEDGVSGWSTMYALTRALQHELGISMLSDTFTPATLNTLQTRGGVLVNDGNANLIKIVQAACSCKGYDGGAITGVFTTTLQAALTRMMGDAGLSHPIVTAVPPKIVKALLTMDAYQLLPGGNPAIRAVQRWLNNRYLERTNFFLIACNGVLTRDIQKACGTIVFVKGTGFFRQNWTKSDAGFRTMVLPRFAVAVLMDRKLGAADNPIDAIFASRCDTWLSPHNVRRQWRQARADAGLEWVTPHTFRKTVATLINKEADTDRAAAQLGHGSKEVTKKHYIEQPALAPDSSDILQQLGAGRTTTVDQHPDRPHKAT